MVTLEEIELPSAGGLDATLPPIAPGEYEERLTAAVGRMKEAELDFLLVYADREHFANLAFLTGFDPRFEEALLLLDSRGNRLLLVGNECLGILPDPQLHCRPVLFQEFSLMGQPRGHSHPLRNILSEFGIAGGSTVGCAGWKYFEGTLLDNPQSAIEIPSYIVDLLRNLAGDGRAILNANALFMNPCDGLRMINSVDQIAQFEFAAIRTSESVLAVLRHIREGVAENELEKYFRSAGLPLTCHPMISFGAKARRALSSPSDNRARLGDAFLVAFGARGALTCRAGAVARGPRDLPSELREFYPRFAANYFEVIACWYEQVRIGVPAGEVFNRVEARRDKTLFDLALNPGHYIHLDEWVHSPFSPGSNVVLKSGTALQADIIPVSRGPFCCVDAEDGLVLADETLRAQLAARHPECWKRIETRRSFMSEVLGISLHETVLPLGNTSGWLAPYALEPNRALVQR